MPSPRKSLRPRSASRPEPKFDSAWATAGEIAAAVTAGRTSAATVVEDALARITQRDPVLNAFTDVLADRAEPADARERAEFAWICRLKGLHAGAVRQYELAFKKEPKLADDLAGVTPKPRQNALVGGGR